MNDLVKTDNTFNNVPDYLKGIDTPVGTEALKQGDYKLPRVKLLQSTSPECRAFPGQAIPGQFWHDTANINLGNSFIMVAANVAKKAILFRPRHQGGGVLAFSNDAINWHSGANKSFTVQPIKDNVKTVNWETKANVAQSGLTQFGTSFPDLENSAPAVTGFFEYLVFLPDFPQLSPCLFSCSKTSIPSAKALNTTYMMMRKPIAAIRIKVKSQEINENSNTWYNPSFEGDGWVDAETFKIVSELGKQYKDYKADYEHLNEEQAVATTEKKDDEIPF